MGDPAHTHKVEVDVTMKDSGKPQGPAKLSLWLPLVSAVLVAVLSLTGTLAVGGRAENIVNTRVAEDRAANATGEALDREVELTKAAGAEAGAGTRQAYIIEATMHAEATRTEAAIRLVPGTPVPVPTILTAPTETLEPSATPDPNSPAAAVADYLAAIQEGRYAFAWNMTTQSFKEWFNGDVFADYEGFWSTASPLSVVEIAEEPIDPRHPLQASVIVRQLWEIDQAIRASRYLLIRSDRIWLIDRIEALP